MNPKQVFLGCSFQRRTNTHILTAQDIAEEFAVSLVFGDNSPRAEQIRDQAFGLISQSRIVIFDLSSENVNIGVEYGFAHGMRKKHIYLICQKPLLGPPRIPAMLTGLQYKSYAGLEGFSKAICACLEEHYVRSGIFIDEQDEARFSWLQREIRDLLEELERATSTELSLALNAHKPDIVRAAARLAEKGLIRRIPNGADPIYELPEHQLAD